MKGHKKYQLQDLIEKIQKTDDMIKMHSSNPSKFMLGQYQAKKDKLLSYLIAELTEADVRSAYSFKLIVMALIKFYPELGIGKPDKIKRPKKNDSDELKELEKALVA